MLKGMEKGVLSMAFDLTKINCPYCGEEMQAGYILGLRRLAWGRSMRKFALYAKENEITLSESFNIASVQAQKCSYCRIVLIKY